MQTPYWEVSETDYHTDASVHSLSIPAAFQVNQSAKCCSAKGMRQHSLGRLRGSDGISDIFRPPVDSDSALGSFSWLLPKRWSGKLMKIDPPAILHMVWNSNWIQLCSTVRPHGGTSSGLTGCRYPHVIQSLNQANRSVNLSGQSGWREKCYGGDWLTWMYPTEHAKVSINPCGPIKLSIYSFDACAWLIYFAIWPIHTQDIPRHPKTDEISKGL